MILYIHIDPTHHPSNLYINSSSNPQNCLCEVIDSSLSSNSNRPFAGAFFIIQQTQINRQTQKYYSVNTVVEYLIQLNMFYKTTSKRGIKYYRAKT